MDDLRFALTVLSLHAEDRLDELDLHWGSDTASRRARTPESI